MVSKEAVVESSQSANPSLLRQSSESFKETAVSEGWVTESRSLMDFANILFGSDNEQTDREADSYTDRIGAKEAAVPVAYALIEADASQAANGIRAVQQLAEERIVAGDVERADLISFEQALIAAQKSYRSFAEATGIVGTRGAEGREATEAALAELAGAIDASRKSADRLADAYAVSEAAGTALAS